MDAIAIQYYFKLDEGVLEKIELQLDGRTLDLINMPTKNLPEWTQLDFHQCPHCPLDIKEHPYCTAAVSLVEVVKRFDHVISYDKIDVEVIVRERRVTQHTTAQRAISSLLGILFPTSGCPHTAFFKPMVRFHLPMSTEADTIFRATGMYLIAQYFLTREGKPGDFELKGLKNIYDNVHLVNQKITERLRSASTTDSSINAVVLLDLFTLSMPMVIEEQMEKIRHWFAPYLSDFYAVVKDDTECF